MPFYNYTTKDGITVQRMCPVGKSGIRHIAVLPTDTVVNSDVPLKAIVGHTAERDIASEHRGRKASGNLWPKFSEALSVHPSQVQELRDHLAEHNVDGEVRDNGDVYVTSAKNYRQHQRLRRFVDMLAWS